jgi:replicative DNA helicase
MDDSMTNRLPPHSRDAERGVLGGILRDPETLDEALRLISKDDFYFDAHQKIFKVVTDLSNENQPRDFVLIIDRLKKHDWLEDVGGPAFLADVWDSVQTGANVFYHAKIIRSAALSRGS